MLDIICIEPFEVKKTCRTWGHTITNTCHGLCRGKKYTSPGLTVNKYGDSVYPINELGGVQALAVRFVDAADYTKPVPQKRRNGAAPVVVMAQSQNELAYA